jgi:hypothetical protein
MVLVLDPDSSGNNAEELPLRIDLFNHWPRGFAWGYRGSGPAQLALAILAEVCKDDQMALDLHQAFNGDVIARKSAGDWSISEEYVRGWIEAMIARPLDFRTEPDATEVEDPADGLGVPIEDIAEIVAGSEGLDPMLVLELVRAGLSDLRIVGELGVTGIHRTSVCYGLSGVGDYKGRISFDTYQNAQLFLKDWNGITLPKVGEDGCVATE